MDITTTVLFVVGLGLLILGAELLVRGASGLAAAVGISPLVVGLTVVAFGTSAPELAVSLQAAAAGQTDLAIGNIVGSNIFNVLFILGISALIAPLIVSEQLVRLDVPLLIVVTTVLLLLALDGSIGRVDGALLFGAIVAYTVFLVRQSRREHVAHAPPTGNDDGATDVAGRGRAGGMLGLVGFVLVGLALLVLGARWLVDGAVVIATALGLSELVIGLTIIAIGTSLPEVATSIVAALRGQRDIAVGNVVGSNISNTLLILGVSGLVATDGLPVAPSIVRFDLPVSLAVAVACLPIFFTGYLIARWEGVLFLGYYVAYTLYVLLDATEHDVLPAFSWVMVAFVVPLTAITLAVLTARAAGGRRPAPAASD